MRYLKQENFNKCMEFLADKPDTVETQQKLYKFMYYENIYPESINITVKNMCIYSRVYATRYTPRTANWCCTMSDGSQVVWNRKYQEFYMIDAVGIDRCDYLNYLAMFPELRDIDTWLLENWSNSSFRMAQKQFIALLCGRYNEYFRNYWR